jgi:hypothetical protein
MKLGEWEEIREKLAAYPAEWFRIVYKYSYSADTGLIAANFPKSALFLEGFQEVTALGARQVSYMSIMRIVVLTESGEEELWNIEHDRRTKYMDMPRYKGLLE